MANVEKLISYGIMAYAEDNERLVSLKNTSKPNVFVLKYKNRVFYDDLWNDFLIEMRGTIVDAYGNIIARPFTKVFNHGEPYRVENVPIALTDEVIAVEKVNGFMACATCYNGELLVSTTGTIDSDFAKLAKSYLLECVPDIESIVKLSKNKSYIFEIVHKSDPHIIEEAHGCYLLAMRQNKWYVPGLPHNHHATEEELDTLARFYNIKRPNWHRTQLGDILNDVKTVTHEGFMCYNNKHEVKIKSPYYLTIKFLSRMRSSKLQQLLKDNPKHVKLRVEEEFYDVIDAINGDSGKQFFELDEEQKKQWLRGFFNETQ